MADAVGSAVAQEAVSRAVSFVLSNREAAASKRRNMERLEMAHTELEFALERSRKLPITDVSLLRQRRMVKRAYEECGDALHRCKLRVLEDEKVEQGVTHSSSLPKRIIHAVKLFISSSVSLKKDELTYSDLRRFEWFADKAGKFVRDVETGCSLAHYRFFSPLIRPLLEGKTLWYKQVRGSRINVLSIAPVWSEERGVEAWIWFISKDRMTTPKKILFLGLLLRLSESTDVVGIAIKCLQLLGPVFKPFAEVAMGELAQLIMQDVSHSMVRPRLLDKLLLYLHPDPLCCRADVHEPCADNTVTSKFPAQVAFMSFCCFFPAFEYNLESSADGAGGNVVRDLPPLELWAYIAPHRSCLRQMEEMLLTKESFAIKTIGGRDERINGSLRQMEEMLLTKAIDRFICQPELTEYGPVLFSLFQFIVYGLWLMTSVEQTTGTATLLSFRSDLSVFSLFAQILVLGPKSIRYSYKPQLKRIDSMKRFGGLHMAWQSLFSSPKKSS